MNVFNRLITGSACIAVGFFLFFFGVWFKWSLVPKVFEDAVYNNLELKAGTDLWDAWIEPPVPVYLNLYFFHILNPDDVKQGGKPNVTQIGPYSFLEGRTKINILTEGYEHINYVSYMEYYYDQENTDNLNCVPPNSLNEKCSLDDEMSIINPIIPSVSALLPEDVSQPLIPTLRPPPTTRPPLLPTFRPPGSPILSNALPKIPGIPTLPPLPTRSPDGPPLEYFVHKFDEALQGSPDCEDCEDDIITHTTAGDFMIEGQRFGSLAALKYALIDTLENFLEFEDYEFLSKIFKVLTRNLDFDGLNKDTIEEAIEAIPESIALMAAANHSKSFYTINHGRWDKHLTLNIEKFNGMTELPEEWWPSAPETPSAYDTGLSGICRDIVGTDGTQFPAFMEEGQEIWMFVSQLCRSIWLQYNQTVSYNGNDNIQAYEFRPGPDVFDMGDPKNYCYCPEFHSCVERVPDKDEWDMSGCADSCKDGMIKVSSCLGNLPLILTAPHFLRGDQSLIDAIDGMDPSYDYHDTLLVMEPISAVPLIAHKRIQANMDIKPNADITALNNIRANVFPLLWGDEMAELSEEDEKSLEKLMTMPKALLNFFAIGLGMVLGLLLVVIGSVLCHMTLRKIGDHGSNAYM